MIRVKEAYCPRCGAIVSDENELEYDLVKIASNDKEHEKIRSNLKLLNFDYEKVRTEGAEVDFSDDRLGLLKVVLVKKGKSKRNDTSAIVTHDDLADEVEEAIVSAVEDAVKNGNKLKVKPYKPNRENEYWDDDNKTDPIEYRVCCPVCGYLLGRVVYQGTVQFSLRS